MLGHLCDHLDCSDDDIMGVNDPSTQCLEYQDAVTSKFRKLKYLYQRAVKLYKVI